ncbi:MAG: molybdopterin-guanine dinucleotide biosynthesis protein B [Desulfurivibrio sp.]|nr:molybdopterin-guanine dinucleotide biosynthesis protein B [Desulfurivibrio sp.]MBU4118695.1 molybdopterin-guanine dinucleotide biosynthesis protein B [Pseudomonadota bacterium]
MPPVIAFIGQPDSGKTTLLEKLIPELRRRGYRIGTIKHHVHAFEMDKPGKDTWRHKQAGASTVALSSPTGLGIIHDVDGDLSIEELVGRYYGDIDLVITEGYKRLGLPKIEVFRRALHGEPLPDRDKTWVAMVSDAPGPEDIPCFALDDIIGLANFLENRFIKPFPRQKTSLLVNGQPVYLNSFVESFLRQAITGMTCSLKGCQDPREIIITIRQTPTE